VSLEFEKLGVQVEEMAQGAIILRRERQLYIEELLQKIHRHGSDWDFIKACIQQAEDRASTKKLRIARPVDAKEPLDAAIPAPSPPDSALLIAADGSQIAPNHHASHLFSLINIGVFTYHHGSSAPPRQASYPILNFPGNTSRAGISASVSFSDNSQIVNMHRDRAEIEILSQLVGTSQGHTAPIIAILDQRLLYWPANTTLDTGSLSHQIVVAWQQAMTDIRESGALLVGYIAGSRKQSVVKTLLSFDIHEPDFDIDILESRDTVTGLTDDLIFSRILEPGQRSAVFVDVSHHNESFRQRDPHNEVCFFYLNPGSSGRQIARVDIPRWVANDPQAIAAVHALLVDQCTILGDYPYVLARADEIAVVSRRDHDNLAMMIDNIMERNGIPAEPTAKQATKELARASQTRHEL
jgi:hypothetical protein